MNGWLQQSREFQSLFAIGSIENRDMRDMPVPGNWGGFAAVDTFPLCQ